MRLSAIRVLAIVFFLTTSARAGLILTGGGQLIGAQGGINEFGNLSGAIRTFGSDVINGFPSANSASANAAAAQASLNFSYTQSGDFASLSQSISLFQAGVDLGMAEHRFTTQFTAINNLNFSFTANFNGLGTVGDPQYSVFLLDLTTLGNVFADNSQDPLDLIPVENHTGTLIAGHTYSFSGQSRLFAGNPGSGVSASATGNYLFTTSPVTAVPEPSSIILFALGSLCLFFVGRERSRQCVPVSEVF